MSLKTADGSPMASPDHAATVGLKFTASTNPDTHYAHTFLIHKSEQGPSIIGNDFWHKQRAVFNFPLQCIQLMAADGSVANSIPFRCQRPGGPGAEAAIGEGTAAESTALPPGAERIPVRALSTQVFHPNEGCAPNARLCLRVTEPH